jgi:hypothetical protein
MADPRSEHNHRGDSFLEQLSLDFSCLSLDDWGGLNHSLSHVSSTRSSYAEPFTVATPISEWSDCGSEISRTSRQHEVRGSNLLIGLLWIPRPMIGRVLFGTRYHPWKASLAFKAIRQRCVRRRIRGASTAAEVRHQPHRGVIKV